MRIWNPNETDILKNLHFSYKGLYKDGSKEVMVYKEIGVVKTNWLFHLRVMVKKL